MTTKILTFLKSIVTPLQANQLVNSFDYGEWGEYDRDPNRNYPLCYAEFPASYSRLGSNNIEYYKFGIALLDQPKTNSATALLNHAQLKTRVETAWLVLWEAFYQHYLGQMPNLPKEHVWVNIAAYYNATYVNHSKGDGVWGYRYEIEIGVDQSDCEQLELAGMLANFTPVCL